jgi:hypothetical protein
MTLTSADNSSGIEQADADGQGKCNDGFPP